MGLCNSGVSAGVAVSGQAGGVTLSQAGDYATIFVSNNPPPNGPDTTGIFALSGSFASANIVVRFVADSVNFASGNWQSLNNIIRNDSNTFVDGAFTPPDATALQLNPGSIQGLYAIQVYLVSISSGSMLVGGNTNPGGVAGIENMILAQQQANTTYSQALLLAIYDQTGVDYYSELGGVW